MGGVQMKAARESVYTPKTGRQLVSPLLASKWLERIPQHQRRLSPAHLDRLAQDIRDGRWDENNPQPVIFDETGNLIDGQHRLRAIAVSGKALWLSVVVGVPESVYKVLDTTMPRSAAHVMAASGHKNTTTRASVVRLLLAHGSGLIRSYGASKLGTKAAVVSYGETLNQDLLAKAAETGVALRGIATASAIGAAYYLAAEKSAEDAAVFFDAVRNGERLSADEPAFVLRERLIRLKTEGARQSSLVLSTLELVIRAWNSFRRRKRISKLQLYKSGESKDFPNAE